MAGHFLTGNQDACEVYLACSVKDFGGELLIQNGIQRRIFVVTNVQIENIIVENVNMKCIKWIKHKLKSPVLHELYERRIGTDCLKQRFKICLLSSENEKKLHRVQTINLLTITFFLLCKMIACDIYNFNFDVVFLLFFTNHIFNVLPLIFVKEEMLKLFRPVDRGELSFENAKNVAIHLTNIVQNWYISLRML
ncbi:hypothetical protein T05_1125 [Trichinella murrelli]|uniref:Uncharacterized protein n=1 Tax=Trichinella murrelli TaxID=144512 RepID=A0A0V0U4M3_9BILA|nr:hypothetical protein T05_1125 [Trichinella murrelli]